MKTNRSLGQSTDIGLQNDTEPLARYSIQEIASCYVGDLGMKQKKQVILPTLIIHLKPDNQQITSPRSFRRRSHDAPYAAKPTQTALFFRPAADNPNALQPWAREIQFYLNACANAQISQNINTPDAYPDTPQTTSSSLFFVNGEPSTALLSPSIRSKASDLSSIPSDRQSISSSSLSELPSPRVDSHQQDRPTLHIATGSGDYDAHGYHSQLPPAAMPLKEGEEPRRETILDRYFSSYPTPVDVPASGSSIARFEALMEDIENKSPAMLRKDSFVKSIAANTTLCNFDLPARIPTPTLRALEYVSTGIRHDVEDEIELADSKLSSRRSSFILYDESDIVVRRRASGNFDDYLHSPNRSRRNSDSSFGGGSSITGGRANSVVGSLSGFTNDKMNSAATTKRHSISDFNLRLLPPHLGVTSAYHSALTAVGQGSSGIDRPGSISDFTHDFTDEATLKKLATAPNYHSRNNRPPVPPPIRPEW